MANNLSKNSSSTLRAMGSRLLCLVLPVFQKRCDHEFYISDIERTNIPEIPTPKTRGYNEWMIYFGEYYQQPAITKRIKCGCLKCEETFYAHCGLDLPGKLRQRKKNAGLSGGGYDKANSQS